ncbi:MAG TPA: dockerin type I repeat-containing protein [Clostridia bacterium]
MKSKKLFSCLVTATLFMQVLSGFGTGPAYSLADSQGLVGDLSGDGKINSTDSSLLKRYLLGSITEFPVSDKMWAADVNGDNNINSTDYSFMKRYLLGTITSFPKTSTNTPTPTPTPTRTPTPTPPVSSDDRYFSASASQSELISKATAMKVSEEKAVIKKQVDEHYDTLVSYLGFKSKDTAYAFFFGMATRESTFRAGTETGSQSAHAFGPLQCAETAYANADPSYMPENDVPEMKQYDFTPQNFYDVGFSVHMGIRHYLHFAKQAKAKYSGKDVLRYACMGYNTGWIDRSDESWVKQYADETASLAGWYLKNGHMSDDEFTWDTDPRVDRSNPWGWY